MADSEHAHVDITTATTTATASGTLVDRQRTVTTRREGNTIIVEEVIEEEYGDGHDSDSSTEHTPLLPTSGRAWYQGRWQKRFKRACACGWLSFLLLILLAGSLLAHWLMTDHTCQPDVSATVHPIPAPVWVRSNGTHLFNRTVVIISVDGFRNDMLERGFTPHLLSMAKDGVRAKYLQPSFPSNTYPNHYTLATGLYPSAHGIISNRFYDSVLNDTFSYGASSRTPAGEWWGGEPFWTTAIKQGQRSAMYEWPGSLEPIDGYLPSYRGKVQRPESLHNKVKQTFEWIDLPAEQRPQLIGIYVGLLDNIAHHYGLDSSETNNSLSSINRAVRAIDDGIAARNLTDIVDLIVLGDHGMTKLTASKVIYLKEYIDLDRIYPIYNRIMAIITPRYKNETQFLYDKMRTLSKHYKFSVYWREDVPDHLNFRYSPRIGPIVCIINEPGWVFDGGILPANSHIVHGYDPEMVDMRTFFIARGPHIQRSNSTAPTVDSFVNVNVYNLVTHLLNLKPAPNNGTDGWLADSGILRTV